MNIHKFINWHELSKSISDTGSDQTIRPNRIPKKYRYKVDRLLKVIDTWLKWAGK